jgi:DNA helicase-2/ATP-dependent DNA helicase PcrA
MPEDLSYLLNDLNEPQREAVSAKPGHRLVLAGPGSGKTRVLTHRIAWLIEVEHISPFAILAVTFTNKAAAEMRSRLETLRGIPVSGMWVGTFHGIAHRLLRMHWREANLSQTFQILDSNDQNRLVRRVLKDLGLDESKWPIKQAQWFINNKKDEGLRPQHIDVHQDLFTMTMVKIYEAYELACERAGVVDFAELLLRSHELWLNQPELLQHYQQRFKHILVDEFQDTNALQYAWLRLLAGKDNYLMLVGDDDQSIYGWRGAKIENILRFSSDYPDTQTTRLEQNYRSTGTILRAANSLIANNGERLGKDLWTERNNGEPISVYAAFNEIDEARFMVNRLQDWLQQGNNYSEAAIMYRSNAQSRVIEEALLQAQIPYRVYGGQRFFERAEIKDALGYMRLTTNRHDDTAFERVVNLPTRGIGDRTLEVLREYARSHNISLWSATQQTIIENLHAARAANALQQFIQLIDDLSFHTKELPLHEQTEHIIQASGLHEYYKKEKGEQGQMRLENLAELITATRQFVPSDEHQLENFSTLQAFLAHAALEAGEAQANLAQDYVQMMTLHSAKGLEFPLVFISGVEEGLFPHQLSINEPGRLEEERRLCFVGITRAMQKLYLCYAQSRRVHGREEYHRPSRFLSELPTDTVEEVRLNSKVKSPSYNTSFSDTKTATYTSSENYPFRLGSIVTHAVFGQGVVMNYEGQNTHLRIQVAFKKVGTKWLMVDQAKLTQ